MNSRSKGRPLSNPPVIHSPIPIASPILSLNPLLLSIPSSPPESPTSSSSLLPTPIFSPTPTASSCTSRSSSVASSSSSSSYSSNLGAEKVLDEEYLSDIEESERIRGVERWSRGRRKPRLNNAKGKEREWEFEEDKQEHKFPVESNGKELNEYDTTWTWIDTNEATRNRKIGEAYLEDDKLDNRFTADTILRRKKKRRKLPSTSCTVHSHSLRQFSFTETILPPRTKSRKPLPVAFPSSRALKSSFSEALISPSSINQLFPTCLVFLLSLTFALLPLHAFRPVPLSHNFILSLPFTLSNFFRTILSSLFLPSAAASLPVLLLLKPKGVNEWAGRWTTLLGWRMILGWAMGRAIGWTWKEGFWSEAGGEVGGGLTSMAISYYLTSSSSPTTKAWEREMVMQSLAVATVVCFSETRILFWTVSALFAALSIVLLSKLFGSSKMQQAASSQTRKPSTDFKTFNIKALFIICLLILNHHFTPRSPELVLHKDLISSAQLPDVHVLIMTAPRPSDPLYLEETIKSYLDWFDSPIFSSSNRKKLTIYTHFEKHEVFDQLKGREEEVWSGEREDVKWVRRVPKGGDRTDQRLHLARGIEKVVQEMEMEWMGEGGREPYLMLAEDDFPMCRDGENDGALSWMTGSNTNKLTQSSSSVSSYTSSWQTVEDLLRISLTLHSSHCSLFIGTGGSGLLIPLRIARLLPSLLLPEDPSGNLREAFPPSAEEIRAEPPTDVVIQDFLRGRIGGVCEGKNELDNGKGGMVISERLLMRHLGFNTSTVPGRRYGEKEWECGWRHAFVSFFGLVSVGKDSC